jgi:hypothetical protein
VEISAKILEACKTSRNWFKPSQIELQDLD